MAFDGGKIMKLTSVALKLLFGIVLGIAITAIYTYNNPSIIIVHAKKDPKFGLYLIKHLIATSQELNDATAVIATQSSTQFGKEFYNNLSEDGRRSIIAHPYDKQGSGVSITVSYLDSTTGERKIMLMQKLIVRNKIDNGLKKKYDQIGGYTKGAGVEGSKIEEIDFEKEELRDAAEDHYVDTGKSVTINTTINSSSKGAAVKYLGKHDFVSIGKAISQYNIKVAKENPYIKNFNPKDIKSYLEILGIKYTRDYNAIDTVLREFLEETCYNGEITPSMIKEIYTTDNYGTDNVPNLHTKVSHYLIDLGTFAKAPIIYPANYQEVREVNSFKANGTEIGHLIWASVNELEPKENGELEHNNVSISYSYIPILHNAIKMLRNLELEQVSNGIISNDKQIFALTKHFQVPSIQKHSKGEFGQNASIIHKFNRCVADKIKHSKLLNHDTLSDILNKC